MAKKAKAVNNQDSTDASETPDTEDTQEGVAGESGAGTPDIVVDGDLVENTDAPPVALRTDGPTLEEWVTAGYPADTYPPEGYAVNTVSVAPIPDPIPDPNANKAKLQAPPNVSGHVTFQGVSIEIKDGFVTVEHFIAKHLREAFGFKDAE